jgi:hypothetical protein
LCAGQEPAFAAHSGGGWPTASLADDEVTAQATTAAVAITAPTNTSATDRATRGLILFVNDIFQ